MSDLFIPTFNPYPYQREDLEVLGRGVRRVVWVWHRRAGKDITSFLGWMVPEALRVTATYFYVFPTYAQGKKIIWDGIDSSGVPVLDYLGGMLGMTAQQARKVIQYNETELQITLPPVSGGSQGSIIQLIGTDNMDRVVGTNPKGVILSEYALQKPQVWSYLRPILEANGGWALFVYTPRGLNHAHKLYQEAIRSPNWYASKRTVMDTQKHDGSPIISLKQIETMREEGEDEDIIQQEYFCSFSGAQAGSYYSHLVTKAYEEGRVRSNVYDPNLAVDTFWDIGSSDKTVIGFRQTAYNERRWIRCVAESRQSLEYFASLLNEFARKYGYRYRHHYFPHDMKVVEFTSNEARILAAQRLGIRPATCITKRPFFEGVDAVRRSFPRYWFDKDHCEDLLTNLSMYHKKWNKEGAVFSDQPEHDESSHYADMVRYEAIVGDRFHRDDHIFDSATTTFDPFTYHENIQRWDAFS
jgi:hypothetical protein